MDRPTTTSQALESEKPAAAYLNHDGDEKELQLDKALKPEPFQPSKTFSIAKLFVGSFNIVFASIVLFFGTISIVNTTYAWGNGYSFVAAFNAISLAAASIIWQFAELITLAVRHKSGWRPIHPGAHIGVHLVLEVFCVIVLASLATYRTDSLNNWGVDARCIYEIDASYALLDCPAHSFFSVADVERYFLTLKVLVAFSALMLISHLTLLVMACVEADRKRKYGKEAKVAPGLVDG